MFVIENTVIGTLIRMIAYIDPGTGSLILQLLLGGIAGGWVMIKLFGKRIAQFLGLSKKEQYEDNADSSGKPPNV